MAEPAAGNQSHKKGKAQPGFRVQLSAPTPHPQKPTDSLREANKKAAPIPTASLPEIPSKLLPTLNRSVTGSRGAVHRNDPRDAAWV